MGFKSPHLPERKWWVIYFYKDNDLGVDQLDAVELLKAIEEEFNLEISDAEAEIIRTVQELVNFISSKKVSSN
ncbi:MAG: acyl carrier protein [Aphanizomenon sp.]